MIFVLSLGALLFLGFSPIKTILFFTTLGVLYKFITRTEEVK